MADVLLVKLEDREAWVRAAAAEALGAGLGFIPEGKRSGVADAILAGLRDGNPNVRRAVAGALGVIYKTATMSVATGAPPIGAPAPGTVPVRLTDEQSKAHEKLLGDKIVERFRSVKGNEGEMKEPWVYFAELGFALKIMGRSAESVEAFTHAKTLAKGTGLTAVAGRSKRRGQVTGIEQRRVKTVGPRDIHLEYEKLAWRGNWIKAVRIVDEVLTGVTQAKAYAKLALTVRARSGNQPQLGYAIQDWVEMIEDFPSEEIEKGDLTGELRLVFGVIGFIKLILSKGTSSTVTYFDPALNIHAELPGVNDRLFQQWVEKLKRGEWDAGFARMVLEGVGATPRGRPQNVSDTGQPQGAAPTDDIVARLDVAESHLARGEWMEALRIIDDPPLMSRPFHERALALAELAAVFYGKVSQTPLDLPLAHNPSRFRQEVVKVIPQIVTAWEGEKTETLTNAQTAALLGYVNLQLGNRQTAEAYFTGVVENRHIIRRD